MPSVSPSDGSWAEGSGRHVSLGLSIGPTPARPAHLSSSIHVPTDLKMVEAEWTSQIILETSRRGQDRRAESVLERPGLQLPVTEHANKPMHLIKHAFSKATPWLSPSFFPMCSVSAIPLLGVPKRTETRLCWGKTYIT